MNTESLVPHEELLAKLHRIYDMDLVASAERDGDYEFAELARALQKQWI